MGCVLKYIAFKVSVNGDAVFFAFMALKTNYLESVLYKSDPVLPLEKLLNLQAMEDGRDEHLLR